MKRTMLLCVAMTLSLTGVAIAQTAPAPKPAASPEMSIEAFEARFRKADRAGRGALDRKQAYAEFPNMPKYFDEIDANRDGLITIAEVETAWQRRIDRAINTSTASRYTDRAPRGAAAGYSTTLPPDKPRTSTEAERRAERARYYDDLVRSSSTHGSAEPLGTTVVPVPIYRSK